MRFDEIKALLDKYYEGQTNPEEEAELQYFFSGENVPEDLLPDKDMFLFYQREKTETYAGEDEIEQMVLTQIEREEKREEEQEESSNEQESADQDHGYKG